LQHGIGEFENVPSFGESVEDPAALQLQRQRREARRASSRPRTTKGGKGRGGEDEDDAGGALFFIHVSTADYLLPVVCLWMKRPSAGDFHPG